MGFSEMMRVAFALSNITMPLPPLPEALQNVPGAAPAPKTELRVQAPLFLGSRERGGEFPVAARGPADSAVVDSQIPGDLPQRESERHQDRHEFFPTRIQFGGLAARFTAGYAM